jgi:hypothetical protein
VVAWLPAQDRSWSLTTDPPSFLPALLYGDKVTMICPEANDVEESDDFSELYGAFRPAYGSFDTTTISARIRSYAAVPFELLSMGYVETDGTPEFPDIWESLTRNLSSPVRRFVCEFSERPPSCRPAC